MSCEINRMNRKGIVNYQLKIIKSPTKDFKSFLYSNGIPSGRASIACDKGGVIITIDQ
ncbi:MAG: hypothetical protein ACK476_05240 [Fluviicola sp.]